VRQLPEVRRQDGDALARQYLPTPTKPITHNRALVYLFWFPTPVSEPAEVACRTVLSQICYQRSPGYKAITQRDHTPLFPIVYGLKHNEPIKRRTS
jgi:hypothetical protein